VTDGILAQIGEPCLLVSVETPAFDNYDSFDPSTSTLAVQAIRALFSSPSEKEARNLAGRGIDATVRATVPSTCTVQADRPGQPDHVVRVPGAKTIAVASDEDGWTVTIDGTAAYAVTVDEAGVLLGALARSAYNDLVVREVRPDRHPFTGVRKQTLYLQEAVGA